MKRADFPSSLGKLAFCIRSWTARASLPRWLSFLSFALSRVFIQELSTRAASLVFLFLLCAAPTAAFLASLASFFPQALSHAWPWVFDHLQSWLLPDSLEAAGSAFFSFFDNAKQLSAATLLLSLAGAFSLSQELETSFRRAWGEPDPLESLPASAARHALALIYLLSLTLLGSLALGLALLASPSVWIEPLLAGALLPLLLLTLIWSLSRPRPPLRWALLSALLASGLAYLSQFGFAFYWSLSRSYGSIYGAAAVFFGALLWLWLLAFCLLLSISVSGSARLWRQRSTLSPPAPCFRSSELPPEDAF